MLDTDEGPHELPTLIQAAPKGVEGVGVVAEGGVGALAMPEGVGASNFIVRFCIS
jgi:hypothetical protein